MECHLSPLRLARITQGKTQFEIARRARLSASRLSLLERGHDDATREERTALAAALGVNEAEVFPSLAHGDSSF